MTMVNPGLKGLSQNGSSTQGRSFLIYLVSTWVYVIAIFFFMYFNASPAATECYQLGVILYGLKLVLQPITSLRTQ